MPHTEPTASTSRAEPKAPQEKAMPYSNKGEAPELPSFWEIVKYAWQHPTETRPYKYIADKFSSEPNLNFQEAIDYILSNEQGQEFKRLKTFYDQLDKNEPAANDYKDVIQDFAAAKKT
jgi:predicted transcriptional regulator